MKEAHLHKRIWFLWMAGMENPPLIVQRCFEAWRHFNPDWEITVVTRDNIGQFLDLSAIIGPHFTEMEIQALSNVIRLNLLATHGGVWSDATVLCRKPLDSWLPLLGREGFFAFDRPAEGRPFATWFLYGDPQSPLLQRLNDVSNAFWRENPFATTPSTAVNQRHNTFKTLRMTRFNGEELTVSPEAAQHGILWGAEELSRWMRCHKEGTPFDWQVFQNVHPYFWLHYLFNDLIWLEADFAAQWEKCPRLTADLPHAPQFRGLHLKMDAEFALKWQHSPAPVYKLNQWQASNFELKNTVLEFMLNPSHWDEASLPKKTFFSRLAGLVSPR